MHLPLPHEAMSTTFQFVPETHSYLQDGRVIPSVTQLLEAAGLVCYDHIPKAVLDRKAEIGTAAHSACWYFDENDLDRSTVAPEVERYERGWEKFRRETGFTPRLIEQRGIAVMAGMQYGYTLDREGLLRGRDTLIEIKCTAGVEISWGPQMAAYEAALRAQDGKIRQRVAVHLLPDGGYSLLPYTQVSDYQVFQWALGMETWKRVKGRVNGYGNHQSR